jgi:hypothetical protein
MQAPRVLVASKQAEVDALIEKKVLSGESAPPRRRKGRRGDA